MLFSNNGVFYQDFLSQLCAQRNVKTYLEIGVQSGINLSGIVVDEAIGVDPEFKISVNPTKGKRSTLLHQMTSDAFFSSKHGKTVDMAFLDGMHKFEYLLRDFYNTEAICHQSSLIVMHDCLPFNNVMISRAEISGAWTGDVWKVVPLLRKFRPDLKVILVDAAPTGLVCVTNLDPSSRLLKQQYHEIVTEFFHYPNDQEAIEMFRAESQVISATEILEDFNQSRFFRI